jgi:hypothetical protein
VLLIYLCTLWQALSQHGYLTADLKNIGYVDADYTITVSDCSSSIMPIIAQSAAIQAQATVSKTFEIFSTSDQAGDALGCTVKMLTSQVRRKPYKTHGSALPMFNFG